MIAEAGDDALTQTDPDADDLDAFLERYPKTQVRDFDGNPDRVSELDALIAYLQMITAPSFTSSHSSKGSSPHCRNWRLWAKLGQIGTR